ncbi:MAG TPA: glycosyltransferase [Candidatus Acidoferrales bacterium]|nr:glycosyltransferase [Candidatus Acidoferrales bacterium]
MAALETPFAVGSKAAVRPVNRTARPLRVLMVAGFSGDPRTGAGNAVLSLVDALRRRGHTAETLLREDVPGWATSARSARVIFPMVAARRIAREAVKYDVVVIHEPSAGPYLLARKWNAGLPPCVVMSHGVEQRCWDLKAERTPRSWRARAFHPATELAQANYSLRHADAVVCLSSEDAEFVHRSLGVPPQRIHRIHNGVDAERFGAEWSLSPEPRLLFAGSWIPRKGTREFAAAFAELRRLRPGLGAMVLGSGLPPQAVRADFTPADREAVEVLPNVSREELPGLLARDQIFVLPSHFEGMPLTLLEAMAAGLPCVTTDTCGMRDLVTQGDNGALVPTGSADALAAAVSRLLDSPAQRKRMGTAARETARRTSWDTAAEAWESLLAGVAENMPRRFILQEGRWSDELAEDPRERLASVLLKLSEELQRSPDGFREMEQWQDLRIAGRILDLGCGTGWKAASLERNGSNTAVAVDYDFRLLEFGRKTFGVRSPVQSDGCALPFPSAHFDWVLAIEVIEHVRRPDLLLRELHRVLRPGGKLLLTTPNRLQYLRPWHPCWFYRALRGRMVLEPSHVREIAAPEFRQILPPGLELERLRYRGTLCGWPLPIGIESVPQPFRGLWAQGIEIVARKADARGA